MGNLDKFLPWLDELIADARSVPRTDWDAMGAWRTRVENFLLQVVGSDHVHYQNFVLRSSGHNVASSLDGATHQLAALRDDMVKGRLSSLRGLVVAEVFSDFLDMAAHLLSNGYKDAAASVTGAVLERGLRDIAAENGLKVRSRDDLTSLCNRLAEKAVFNRLMQKNIGVWIAVRNHADHGEFEEYTLDDVRSMHAGVQAFLAQYSPS